MITKLHLSGRCDTARIIDRSRRSISCILFGMGVILATDLANADRRIFAYTYPYMTLPKGGFEIEHYLDASFARVDNPHTPSILEDGIRPAWEHQIEFEYGITDKWDFGLYNVFRQNPYESFEYRGPKLRTRYRFWETGEFFVDPAIYLEVGYFGDELEIEQRLIFAKDIGDVELSLNLKFEEELEFSGSETEFEFIFNPTFGLGYHLTGSLALGVEYFGHLEVEHGEIEHFAHYLGPVVNISGKHFWWTIAFQPQLSSVDGHAAVQVRSLFGIVL